MENELKERKECQVDRVASTLECGVVAIHGCIQTDCMHRILLARKAISTADKSLIVPSQSKSRARNKEVDLLCAVLVASRA